MITIYGPRASSAFRCIWFLEEMGESYELKAVDMKAGEHKSPDFLKLNPNGKVPVLVDGDFVIWESLAINYYLMEKYGATQFVGTTPEEHGQVNQWTIWSMIELSTACMPLVSQKWRGLPDSEATETAKTVGIPKHLQILEDQLKGHDYLVMDTFTLADITATSVVDMLGFVNFDLSAYPEVKRWHAAMTSRPAYVKARG